MNLTINFQKQKRNYIILTFDDEKEDGTEYEHVIQVGMPKKRVYDAMLDIQSLLEDIAELPESERKESEIYKKQIDELYRLVGVILSNNMAKEKITKDWVEEVMDFEQIKRLLVDYTKFCKGEASNPN